jgi:aspartate beta-hydroxylase
MFLGIEPVTLADPRQRPTFLFFPGLPVHPVFPRDALPFADWYEAQTEAIASEMRRVRDGDGVQPFHYDVPEVQRGQLTTGGAWDAYFFYVDGERVADHHAACPEVSRVLAELPLDHVRDHGPEVCFSIMRPGAHILPHRGVTNARAVLHLGLEIPGGCALNLPAVQEVGWQVGRCFAFDDTYEHEAWNRSDTTRTILLADIWNPYLRAPEREALATLVGVIGDFNRESGPAPRTKAG